MRDNSQIGPWVRRFLMEHLVTDRNLAHNTQVSYRDTLLLLLPFLSQAQKKAVDRLTIDDLSPSGVRSFLEYVEKERGCGGATRNSADRGYVRHRLQRNRQRLGPGRGHQHVAGHPDQPGGCWC